MSIDNRKLSLLLLTFLLTLGCQPSADLNNGPQQGSRRENGSPTRVQRLVSEADARQFAESLSQAVTDNNSSAFNRLIDWQTMANTATADLGLSKNDRQSMSRGLVQGVTGDNVFMKAIQAGEESSYDFMRTKSVQGQRRVLFRLVSPAGLNYHEYTLSSEQGEIRAVDLYVFLSGENLSETWRRLLLPTAKELNKNWLEKLTTEESDFAKNSELFHQLSQEIQQQKWQQALATYKSMPETMQKEKVTMLLRYHAAANISDEELVAAAEEFRSLHPDAKCIELLMLDTHVVRGEYKEALGCAERTMESLGPDSYLEFIAGNMLFEMGQHEKAHQRYQKAVTIEPVVMDALWSLAISAANLKRYDETASTLSKLEERSEMDLTNIGNIVEFAGFLESPQGEKWMTERGW